MAILILKHNALTPYADFEGAKNGIIEKMESAQQGELWAAEYFTASDEGVENTKGAVLAFKGKNGIVTFTDGNQMSEEMKQQLSEYYTKSEIDELLNTKLADYYTKAEVENLVNNTISNLSSDLSNHITNEELHIQEGERAAWNKAKEDIDLFLDANAIKDETINTLKEIQDYISEDVEAAAQMISNINSKVGKEDVMLNDNHQTSIKEILNGDNQSIEISDEKWHVQMMPDDMGDDCIFRIFEGEHVIFEKGAISLNAWHNIENVDANHIKIEYFSFVTGNNEEIIEVTDNTFVFENGSTKDVVFKITSINSVSLTTQESLTYLNDTKADKSEVETALNTKADKSEVDNAFELIHDSSNIITTILGELNTKIGKDDVMIQIAPEGLPIDAEFYSFTNEYAIPIANPANKWKIVVWLNESNSNQSMYFANGLDEGSNFSIGDATNVCIVCNGNDVYVYKGRDENGEYLGYATTIWGLNYTVRFSEACTGIMIFNYEPYKYNTEQSIQYLRESKADYSSLAQKIGKDDGMLSFERNVEETIYLSTDSYVSKDCNKLWSLIFETTNANCWVKITDEEEQTTFFDNTNINTQSVNISCGDENHGTVRCSYWDADKGESITKYFDSYSLVKIKFVTPGFVESTVTVSEYKEAPANTFESFNYLNENKADKYRVEQNSNEIFQLKENFSYVENHAIYQESVMLNVDSITKKFLIHGGDSITISGNTWECDIEPYGSGYPLYLKLYNSNNETIWTTNDGKSKHVHISTEDNQLRIVKSWTEDVEIEYIPITIGDTFTLQHCNDEGVQGYITCYDETRLNTEKSIQYLNDTKTSKLEVETALKTKADKHTVEFIQYNLDNKIGKYDTMVTDNVLLAANFALYLDEPQVILESDSWWYDIITPDKYKPLKINLKNGEELLWETTSDDVYKVWVGHNIIKNDYNIGANEIYIIRYDVDYNQIGDIDIIVVSYKKQITINVDENENEPIEIWGNGQSMQTQSFNTQQSILKVWNNKANKSDVESSIAEVETAINGINTTLDSKVGKYDTVLSVNDGETVTTYNVEGALDYLNNEIKAMTVIDCGVF